MPEGGGGGYENSSYDVRLIDDAFLPNPLMQLRTFLSLF